MSDTRNRELLRRHPCIQGAHRLVGCYFVRFNVKIRIVMIFVLTLTNAFCRGLQPAVWQTHDLIFGILLSLPTIPWFGDCLPHFVPNVQLSSLNKPKIVPTWRARCGIRVRFTDCSPHLYTNPRGAGAACVHRQKAWYHQPTPTSGSALMGPGTLSVLRLPKGRPVCAPRGSMGGTG